MKQITVDDLKDRVSILQETITRDIEQNQIKSYQNIATVWANVTLKQANIADTSYGTKPMLRYVITIRYNASLLPVICRLLYKGVTLEPMAPPYAINNQYIVIEAREIVGVPKNG